MRDALAADSPVFAVQAMGQICGRWRGDDLGFLKTVIIAGCVKTTSQPDK
jgi:hypothetical protein